MTTKGACNNRRQYRTSRDQVHALLGALRHELGQQVVTLRNSVAWARFSRKECLEGDECGLIAQAGIGDHYLVCAFAGAVTRRTGLRVVVAGHAKNMFLSEIFTGVKRYVALPPSLMNVECGGKAIARGAFAYAHFRGLELFRACGYRRFQMIDAYRCLLGLPADEQIELPTAPHLSEVEAARERLRDQDLAPGRTVIICPETRSTPTEGVSDLLWSRLRTELKGIGLVPVVNSATRRIRGATTIDIPLHQFRATVLAAGYFIGLRSGLCDLVCDLEGCSRLVLYPPARLSAGTVFEVASLSGYGLPSPPSEHLIADDDSVVSRILADLSAYSLRPGSRRPSL